MVSVVRQFNLRPMWIATLLTSAGAVLLATPIAVASAMFLNFYLPKRLAGIVERLWEVIAAIPSVCFGLWGLSVLAPWVATMGGSGQNLLTATLTLSLMILPTIAVTSLLALRAVPNDWLDAAAALGLSRAEVALWVALPVARRGIAVGVILGCVERSAKRWLLPWSLETYPRCLLGRSIQSEHPQPTLHLKWDMPRRTIERFCMRRR